MRLGTKPQLLSRSTYDSSGARVAFTFVVPSSLRCLGSLRTRRDLAELILRKAGHILGSAFRVAER